MNLLKKQFKPKLIFIAGTDTGVGKTIVTAALAYYLKRSKPKIGVIKAIQTGQDNDLSFIRKFSGLTKNQLYCPLRLKYPLAPQQAAEIEKKPHIDIAILLDKIKNFSRHFDITLIEGSGGLFVPIKPKYMLIDLIKALKAETILVSRTSLGTINHTLLSIEALAIRKIPILGLIFNSVKEINKKDISSKLNPLVIQDITKIPIIAQFPHQKKFDIPQLATYINWNK